MHTIQELLADPCTPYWAKELITKLKAKDPVDVANTLEVIARAFTARIQSFKY